MHRFLFLRMHECLIPAGCLSPSMVKRSPLYVSLSSADSQDNSKAQMSQRHSDFESPTLVETVLTFGPPAIFPLILPSVSLSSPTQCLRIKARYCIWTPVITPDDFDAGWMSNTDRLYSRQVWKILTQSRKASTRKILATKQKRFSILVGQGNMDPVEAPIPKGSRQHIILEGKKPHIQLPGRPPGCHLCVSCSSSSTTSLLTDPRQCQYQPIGNPKLEYFCSSTHNILTINRAAP